jgi:cysteine desulfurase
MLLKSLSAFYKAQGKSKIIASAIEHPSVSETLNYLQKNGFDIEYLSVNRQGFVTVSELDALIDDNTFLVVCMLANNEIGAIQPLQEICHIAHKKAVPVMSDCVQALGKIPLNLKELGVDYASFSAHKIYGPKGCGLAYIKSAELPEPLIHGGQQEAGRRAGTECVHNIAGFAAACQQVPKLLAKNRNIHNKRETLYTQLQAIFPELQRISAADNCLANTLSLRFPGWHNAQLMAALDMYGISVSSGSACSSGSLEASHVLKAIGLNDEQATETLRISLGENTRDRDINYVVRIFSMITSGQIPQVQALPPSRLSREFIEREDIYLLDIRFWHERQMLKGLPNSHEVSFLFFRRYIKQIPRDKHIVVICMGGIDAAAIAYNLKKRGYERVSFMLAGVIGWRLVQAELYKTMAGENIQRLQAQ